MSSTQQPTDSTDNNQPTPTAQKSGMTRRDLLRRSAVGGATLAGVSTGAVRLDHGPVQESEAIAPVVAAGAAVAAGTSVGLNVGWALREVDPLGIVDAPSGGLSPDAFKQQAYDTARARKSNNQSTFIDNKNIVENIDHAAHADGKIAAIEGLNEQETQSTVEDAALEKSNDYGSTIIKNLLKSWDESVQELMNIIEAADSHDDLDWNDVIDTNASGDSDNSLNGESKPELRERTIELPDGTEFDYHELYYQYEVRNTNTQDTSTRSGRLHPEKTGEDIRVMNPGDGDNVEYLVTSDWNEILTKIEDEIDSVNDGLVTYVDTIYSDVQAGELDTADLLTPREQAALTSEDEDMPQAIADLQALNVPVDLEREAEIYLPDVEATIYGRLGYTGDEKLEVGTIDPDETDDDDDPVYPGSIYLTYDVSQGQGEWSAYEEGIDGGELTFTAEPFAETVYYVDTAAGETVELTEDDFDEDDEDEWVADLSDDLQNAITEVDQIEFYAETEDTQYETIQLQDVFEIVRFTDSDGNEYDESNFERSEPHTDDNYITEEEWKEQQERHEELIEQYEDAQGGVSIPSFEDVLDGEANGLIGIAVVGLVFVFGILSALNPLS